MAIRQIALSLGRAILDRLSPDKEVTAAQLLKITMSLGRAILDRLSGKAQEVQAAQHLLLNGWPGHDRDLSKQSADSAIRERIRFFSDELASNIPRRQRMALQNEELKKLLVVEVIRNEKLRNMRYFHDVADIDLRTARQIVTADREKYPASILAFSQGEALRKELFPEVEEPLVRYEVAFFLRHFLPRLLLGVFVHHNPVSINDDFLMPGLVDDYMQLEISEKLIPTKLGLMTRASQCGQPERIMRYAGILRDPGFQQAVAEGWRLAALAKQKWIRRIEEKILISP